MEKVKEIFDSTDLDADDLINPCDYCEAVNLFPLCEDRATSSACNHCAYKIILYCNYII